jgi:hypothetical protein
MMSYRGYHHVGAYVVGPPQWGAMPLASTTYRERTHPEGLSFQMVDGGNAIRVDLQRTLMAALGASPSCSDGRDLSTFERHREQLEQIARQKYDCGEYHDYANSRIVVIARADWEGLQIDEGAARLPRDDQQEPADLHAQSAADGISSTAAVPTRWQMPRRSFLILLAATCLLGFSAPFVVTYIERLSSAPDRAELLEGTRQGPAGCELSGGCPFGPPPNR